MGFFKHETRTFYIATCKALILSQCLFGATASPAQGPAQKIEVHGHRGARARYPENTLPAFRHALAVGVDYLELDVGISSDNQIVIGHDLEISPEICKPSSLVPQLPAVLHALTLAKIQSLDCGTLPNPRFPARKNVPNTPMPILGELFELLRKDPNPLAKTVQFNIETKIDPAHPSFSLDPKTFAKLLIDTLKKHNVLSRTLVQSFDYRTLAEVKALDSSIKTSALSENYFDNSVAIAKRTGANVISPQYNFVSAESIEKLHDMGVKVVPWTANDHLTWARLVRAGVDGIITDDPEALIEWLKLKGLR